MKTLLLSAAVSLLAAAPGMAETRVADLSVPGMTCPSCPFVVQAAIGAVDGVSSVTTDLDAHRAQVTFDDAVTSIEAITSASANAGYEAEEILAGADQG